MKDTQVILCSNSDAYQEKEALYLETRRKENRILTDDLANRLPIVEATDPFVKEWIWRSRTLTRFQKYLSENSRHSGAQGIKILDLGCGNGWMSNKLAEQPGCEVWAVDLNLEELKQGARLFGRENLHFIYADILLLKEAPEMGFEKPCFAMQHFDFIILAASVQYFPDLTNLIQKLRNLLNIKGEIHILDAPFYPDNAAQLAAKSRSIAYYTKLGMPEMAQYYHHHLWPEAAKLGGENLNSNLKTNVLQGLKWLAPFPWIRFR